MKIRMNQSRNFFVVVISKNHDWTNKLSAPQESRSAIPMFGSVGVFASESRLQKGKEKWQEETSSLTGRGAGGANHGNLENAPAATGEKDGSL